MGDAFESRFQLDEVYARTVSEKLAIKRFKLSINFSLRGLMRFAKTKACALSLLFNDRRIVGRQIVDMLVGKDKIPAPKREKNSKDGSGSEEKIGDERERSEKNV